jgi:hypothetical protein
MMCVYSYKWYKIPSLRTFLCYRCIKTYEVEFSPAASSEFHRVNSQDTIFLSFQYAVPSGQYVFSLSETKEDRYCVCLSPSQNTVLLSEGDILHTMDRTWTSMDCKSSILELAPNITQGQCFPTSVSRPPGWTRTLFLGSREGYTFEKRRKMQRL